MTFAKIDEKESSVDTTVAENNDNEGDVGTTSAEIADTDVNEGEVGMTSAEIDEKQKARALWMRTKIH